MFLIYNKKYIMPARSISSFVQYEVFVCARTAGAGSFSCT